MPLEHLEIASPESGDGLIPNPPWNWVEREIHALDGDDKDNLVMCLGPDANMIIAGGNENRYIVFGQLDKRNTFVCASGIDDDSKKEVAVYGDLIPYASINVVDLITALAAAKEFYDTGRLPSNMTWENDPRQ